SEEIIKIVDETIQIESKIIEDCMSNVNTTILTKDNLIKRIKYVADVILIDLINHEYYFEENPFDFMTNSILDFKTNFFEKTNTSYTIDLNKLSTKEIKNLNWD